MRPKQTVPMLDGGLVYFRDHSLQKNEISVEKFSFAKNVFSPLKYQLFLKQIRAAFFPNPIYLVYKPINNNQCFYNSMKKYNYLWISYIYFSEKN